MAGQVWVVVALFGIVAVTPCCASAEAQLVYNSDGTIRLEVVNTGIPGQSLQGRYSWQTPEDKLVWIQYPINHQGYIPWTPAEYTYSVASDPTKRVFPVVSQIDEQINLNHQVVNDEYDQPLILRSDRRIDAQISNNNYQSPTLVQSIPKEDKNEIKIEEATFENPPITESVAMEFPDTTTEKLTTTPTTTTEELPVTTTEKLPVTTTEKLPVTTTEKLPVTTEKLPVTTEKLYATTTEKPIPTTSYRPRFTLPFTTTTMRPLPFTPASFTPYPRRRYRPSRTRAGLITQNPSYSVIYKPKTTSTTTTEEPDYIEIQTESPVEVFSIQSKVDALTRRPIDVSNIETIDMRDYVVDAFDEEIIPAPEPYNEINVYNEIDNTNSVVETNEQLEDTTELGPVIRLTSRGRPQLSNRIPQKQNPETRKQSFAQKPNNRPVPRLIEDPSIRQIHTRRPASTENRFRRPGIRNRPGRRFRPGFRRNPITENALTRLNIQTDEQSNRGVARSPPMPFRIRNQGYARET